MSDDGWGKPQGWGQSNENKDGDKQQPAGWGTPNLPSQPQQPPAAAQQPPQPQPWGPPQQAPTWGQQPPQAPQPPAWLTPPQQQPPQQPQYAQGQTGWGPQQQAPAGWGQPAVQTRPYAPTKKTEPAAVAAFVLSLCGPLTWGLSCIVALFLAYTARRNIAVDTQNRKGNDLIFAAQVISGITLVVILLITLALFVN